MHISVKFEAFFFLGVVFCEGLQINHRDAIILGVELVKLLSWIRLSLWIGRVVPEFVGFSVLLVPLLVGLFSHSEVEISSSIDT